MTYYKFPDGDVYDFNHEPYDKDAIPLSRAEGERERAKYCQRELRKLLKPGDEVYTILRHVSQSGMSRNIDTVIAKKGQIQNITNLVADACGSSKSKAGSIKIGGCGMDMGFEIVYRLGCSLWPKGTRKPHGTRNGEPDHAGGYALVHRWL